MKVYNIAIFASGDGSNAQKIIEYFKGSSTIKVVLVVCNKPTANVLNRAKNENIPSLLISRADFYESNRVTEQLHSYNIDFVILAGFLWLIPQNLITAFPDKIINIHPALLPAYGGKGMYGMNVHEAVIAAREKESGITIHLVNEKYDEGKIIEQHRCSISETDTPQTLAQNIHQLEHRYFPAAIERFIQNNNNGI